MSLFDYAAHKPGTRGYWAICSDDMEGVVEEIGEWKAMGCRVDHVPLGEAVAGHRDYLAWLDEQIEAREAEDRG